MVVNIIFHLLVLGIVSIMMRAHCLKGLRSSIRITSLGCLDLESSPCRSHKLKKAEDFRKKVGPPDVKIYDLVKIAPIHVFKVLW